MSFTKSLGRPRVAVIAAAVAASMLTATPVLAGSVENLERERAMILETLLHADLTPDERFAKSNTSRRRLVDLERIVLRDDKLTGRNTPAIRKAFANYDLTFLVHAASEKQMLVLDNWFDAMGLTTQALLSTRVGAH